MREIETELHAGAPVRASAQPSPGRPGGSSLLLAPFVLSSYAVLVLSCTLVLAIACLGLNLLLGQTGLLSRPRGLPEPEVE